VSPTDPVPDPPLLSDHWLTRARRLNPYYRDRLGWKVPRGWPADVSSAEFALRVAAFQKEQGASTIDGIMGPATWAALKGKVFQPPASDTLIIAGRKVPVSFPVVTWDEPAGMSFYERKGWSRRADPSGKRINLFVLHWDGCTSSRHCFHLLLERGLSVQLLLDGDGTVYQALDLAKERAWHAGNFNERSVGVEIQNPVELHRNEFQTPRREVVTELGVNGGKASKHLDFYEVQKLRVAQLTEVLCAELGIPRQLPLDSKGAVTRTLAPAGYRGVAGHYHLSKEKWDPGLSLWPTLQESLRQSPAVA
jgi:N-acetyl-anhydromuramyl-L-alanine amidase AmpD